MKPFKLILSAGLLACVTGMAALPAMAEQAKTADMTRLLQSRLGNVDVAKPVETPVEGVYQTQFGSKFAYLSENGRYLLIGDMIDLQSQVNLTELSRRGVAKKALAAVPSSELAVYPAKLQRKAVLNVFTDTSCPYCKKLHEEVPELQKAGIEVRYFPFPRGGARGPGYTTLRQVWCGKDRADTMDIAKGVTPGDLPSADCSSAVLVDKGFQLGNEVGVTGTPALFTSTGKKFDGYVPYQQLIPMILGDS